MKAESQTHTQDSSISTCTGYVPGDLDLPVVDLLVRVCIPIRIVVSWRTRERGCSMHVTHAVSSVMQAAGRGRAGAAVELGRHRAAYMYDELER